MRLCITSSYYSCWNWWPFNNENLHKTGKNLNAFAW